MPGYIVALNEEQLRYLIALVEQDLDDLVVLDDFEYVKIEGQIRDFRDYLQSIFNTGGNAT